MTDRDAAPAEDAEPTAGDGVEAASGDLPAEADPAGTAEPEPSSAAEDGTDDPLFGVGEAPSADGTDADGAVDPVAADRAGYGSCEEALEDALGSLERVTAERDEYLAVAQRLQADFENYKRRIDAQRVEQAARAAEALVEELLPVLDGCEAALAHGADDVAPIWSSLLGTLEKRGLTKVDAVEVVFDPNLHEAVLTEAGDGIDGQAAVAEIMRAGYQWNGRVIRPAMVKVRG